MVFVIEDVAVEDEHALDDGVAEIHEHEERAGMSVAAPVRDDDAIRPVRMRDGHAVDGFDEKVDLVDVEVVRSPASR